MATIFIYMDKDYNKERREKLKELGYYVYAYLDPREKGDFVYGDIVLTHKPFYIGKGFGYRINEHLRKTHLKRNNHKNHKIKKILSLGLEPIRVKIYEGLTEDESLLREVELISLIGFENLTNVTYGGEGTSGFEQSDKTKKKIGKSNRGKKHTEETKKLISEKLKGREIDDEWRDRISKTMTGIPKKPFTDEHKKNISEGGKGRIPWNKGCVKCQEGPWKGKKLPEEVKKQISKAKTGKKLGPRSEETKNKISETLKEYYKNKT